MSQNISLGGGNGGIVQTETTDVKGEYELSLKEDEDFCTTVVLAIAEIRGIDPLELPPLYNTHDPAAINEMVALVLSSDDLVGELTFDVSGCKVTVSSDGTVTIRDT